MVRKTNRVNEMVAALMAFALVLVSCSTNPATGKRQLAFIGEEQEIAMGREAAEQITQQIGLYPDDELQSYVSRLGKQLAPESERPNLPWALRVAAGPPGNGLAPPGRAAPRTPPAARPPRTRSGRTSPGPSAWSTIRRSTPSPCRAASSSSPAACSR